MTSTVKLRSWKRWATWILVGLGVVILYGALCWLWHLRYHYRWIPAQHFQINFRERPASHTFAAPSDPFAVDVYPFDKSDLEGILDRVLIDLPSWYHALTYPYRLRNSPDGAPYFPASQNSSNFGVPADYITAYLRRMEEASLMVRDSKDESQYLRITIVRSFHPGISLCLSQTSVGHSLRATRLDGSGSHNLGKIGEQVHTTPDPVLVSQISKMVADPEVWRNLSDLEDALFSSMRDGSTWVFEWSTPNDYRCIQVVSPIYLATEEIQRKSEDEFRDFSRHAEMGRLLLQESGLLVEELY